MRKIGVLTFISFLAILCISVNTIPEKEESSLSTTVYPKDITTIKSKKELAIRKIRKQQLITALQTYFDQAIQRKKIIGASVSIVKCDSMIFSGGFGERKAGSDQKVDANTIFRIGSLSKGFAGVLAGIQVEKGMMNWNDKVSGFYPEFHLKNAQITSQITLDKILSHSSGVPRHSFTNLVEDGLSLEDISSEFKVLIPVGDPGTIYSYQNAIYALSGGMMEKRTRKTMSQLLKEDIFEPLQMTSASSDYESLVKSENIAFPHSKRGGRWRTKKINQKYYNAVAAGGINASATDMAKWMRFLLGHDQQVLSSSTLNDVFKEHIVIPGRSKYYQRWKGHVSSHYGFGWRVHSFKNDEGSEEKVLHHGGTVSNYRSEIALFPDSDLGICVLFNSPTRLARNVIPELKEVVMQVLNSPIELNEELPLIL